MGDPQPRDRETIGAGGSEPEATVADLGPNGPPDTLGTTLAGEVDPGQATGGVTLAARDLRHRDRGRGPDARRPRPTSAPDPPPRRRAIAGYQIEGELGRGGMGVVYRARQVRLNRPCALKVILAGAHADPVAAVRFLARRRPSPSSSTPTSSRSTTSARPTACRSSSWSTSTGGSLDRRLDGTPWPARRAATLVEALARGVAEAHRLGIVHRDLKPGNILIAADGTPKIADFGLAKSLDVESGLTATESILGSPSYMAPEQAEGKAKQVGPLADVYALGAILYELLAGRPPFRGTTVLETLEQVKTAEPVPPSRLVPGAAARRRDDRAEVPAEGPGQAVRVGRGAGRGPAAVPGGPADPGAAGLLGRAAAPLGPPEQARGRPAREPGRDAGRRPRRQHVAVDPGRRQRGARPTPTREADSAQGELYTSDMIAIQQAWETGNVEQHGQVAPSSHPRARPDGLARLRVACLPEASEKAGNPVIRTLPLRTPSGTWRRPRTVRPWPPGSSTKRRTGLRSPSGMPRPAGCRGRSTGRTGDGKGRS